MNEKKKLNETHEADGETGRIYVQQRTQFTEVIIGRFLLLFLFEQQHAVCTLYSTRIPYKYMSMRMEFIDNTAAAAPTMGDEK